MLGEGAFGAVTLIEYHEHKFACKQLLANHKENDEHRKQLENESQMLSSLHHPFILTLLYTVEDSGGLALLLEWMPGGDLYQRLKKVKKEKNNGEGYDLETVRFYSANFLVAIEHLHSKKIIHRDIKPENLLINRNGYVALADFGFAKQLTSDEDKAYTFVGSPLYMAPEGILKKGMALSGDAWAYAVTLYEILTGQCLFNDPKHPGDLSKIFLRVLTSKNKGIPFKAGFEDSYPQAADLLKKLLAFDATKRFTLTQSRSHEFFQTIDWDALETQRVPPPYKPEPKTPRAETSNAPQAQA